MEFLFLTKYEIFIKKFDYFNTPYSTNAPVYGNGMFCFKLSNPILKPHLGLSNFS